MACKYLIFLIAVRVIHIAVANDVHYFVSPSGSDGNNGASENYPFQTVKKAWSVAANVPDSKNTTVFVELMAGYHDLDQTLVICRDNTVIRSYNKQEVHLTGGQRIPSSAFKHVTDPLILSRLSPSARQHVRVVHLPDVNVTDYGKMEKYGSYIHRTAPLAVSYNAEPLHLARWPDEGFINIVSVPDGRRGLRFRYNSSVPKTWQNESDPWVYGFWSVAWSDRSEKVTHLDATSQTVKIAEVPEPGILTGHWSDSGTHWNRQQGGYFRFINILGALDQPGEYYMDRDTGNLYVWMPNADGNVKSTDVVYVSILNTCIILPQHARNVVIEDLTIESFRREGIYGANVHDINLSNLEIRNTGLEGINIVGDSRGISISRCLIHDTDRGGIRVSGGNRKLLESSGNTIEDNEIYKYTREGIIGSNGIDVSGVGNTVRYNHVYSGMFTAILFQGNENTINNNVVHHACLELSDCGAIRTGSGDWTQQSFSALIFQRGNLVTNNIGHDIVQQAPGGTNKGVYLDSLFSGTTVTNNVLYNNDIHIQVGGQNNIIENNILYNATVRSIQVDARILNDRDVHRLNQSLHAMPFLSPDWILRYPEIKTLNLQNVSNPEGNRISKNLIHNNGHEDFIGGINSRVDGDRFFNISTIGFSVGEGDHFNVGIGDYRIKCLAAEWANHVGFQQALSPNEVDPRNFPGPYYLHRGLVHHVRLSQAGPCTTHAPARSEPVHSFLPDGSHDNQIFNVTNEGCWLSVSQCSNNEHAVGTYRDMYAERYQHAADNQTMCFRWAVEKWKLCGAEQSEPVAAIYGPTGAMTYAGDGCFNAMYGCPRHGGPADGHVIPGKITRDYAAERGQNGSHDEEGCLSHALQLWHYCGSNVNHPVTSIFRPTGATRTAGGGCWIEMQRCPNNLKLKTMFYDAWGAANHETDDVEIACFNQAEYYWKQCGSNPKYPVTSHFRPTTASKTFP